MANKIFTIANFSQSSTWTVAQYPIGHPNEYARYLESGPSISTLLKYVKFDGIPGGSTINSAVLTASYSSTSAKIRQLDSANFTGSRNVIGKVTPGANVSFEFKFQGSGSTASLGNITSFLAWSNIKIVVDYTEPASKLTLNKTSCKAGDAIRATIAPVASTATHKLKYAMSGITTVVSNLIPAGTKVFDYNIPLAWQNAMPNNASRAVTVTLETYAGATLTGTDEKTFTLTLSDDAYPSIGGISATLDSNGVPAAITKYVQGKSKALVEVSGALGTYDSTIASYQIAGNGQTINASSGAFGPFPNAGEVIFTATVTDSRGRKATAAVTITVDAYAPPALSLPVAYRSTAQGVKSHTGQSIAVKSGVGISSVSGENTAVLEARFGEKGGVMSPFIPLTQNQLTVIGNEGVLITNSYDVQLRVNDLVGESYTFEASIPTAGAGLNLKKNASGAIIGAAVGGYAEHDDAFNINFSRLLIKGAPISLSFPGMIVYTATDTNPGPYLGGTWERYAKGRVLVGLDEDDADFSTPGASIGAKLVNAVVSGIAKLGVTSTSLWVKRKTQSWQADGKGALAGAVAANTDNLSSGIEIDASAGVSTIQPGVVVYCWVRTE